MNFFANFRGKIISIVSDLDLIKFITISDLIFFGSEQYVILSVNPSNIIIEIIYNRLTTNDIFMYKWTFGYEWYITFLSYVSNKPCLISNSSNRSDSSKPSIQTYTLRNRI